MPQNDKRTAQPHHCFRAGDGDAQGCAADHDYDLWPGHERALVGRGRLA